MAPRESPSRPDQLQLLGPILPSSAALCSFTPSCLSFSIPLLHVGPPDPPGLSLVSGFSVAPICSLLSLQVLLETLAGQRAVRMHGAQPKYLVSLLPRQVGRERGRVEQSGMRGPAGASPAAADSLLRVGRAPDSCICLAGDKPVSLAGAAGPSRPHLG